MQPPVPPSQPTPADPCPSRDRPTTGPDWGHLLTALRRQLTTLRRQLRGRALPRWWVRLDRRRPGVAAVALVLLTGVATATVAEHPPQPPPTITPAEALAAREQAAELVSRSADRTLPTADELPNAARPGGDPPRLLDPPETLRDGPRRNEPRRNEPRRNEPTKPPASRSGERSQESRGPGQETERPRDTTSGKDSRSRRDSSERRPPAPIHGLDQRQMAHAAIIVQVGQEMGLPEKAYVIALATAMQESALRVLANPAYPESFHHPHDGTGYDHDSVGIFQQRPSSGWGSVAECMDPAHSARLFYERLRGVVDWYHLPVTVAAQQVQVSAFPDYYAKHEWLARALVDTLA